MEDMIWDTHTSTHTHTHAHTIMNEIMKEQLLLRILATTHRLCQRPICHVLVVQVSGWLERLVLPNTIQNLCCGLCNCSSMGGTGFGLRLSRFQQGARCEPVIGSKVVGEVEIGWWRLMNFINVQCHFCYGESLLLRWKVPFRPRSKSVLWIIIVIISLQGRGTNVYVNYCATLWLAHNILKYWVAFLRNFLTAHTIFVAV